MEIDTGTNELLCVVKDGVALITMDSEAGVKPSARKAFSIRPT